MCNIGFQMKKKTNVITFAAFFPLVDKNDTHETSWSVLGPPVVTFYNQQGLLYGPIPHQGAVSVGAPTPDIYVVKVSWN